MVLALWVGLSVVVLVLLGLFVFGLRQGLIQRSGGTFDCSLRWDVSEEPDSLGKGWVYGVARYSGDRVDWFRVFSYAPRPPPGPGAFCYRGGRPTAARGRGGAGAPVRLRRARLPPPGDPPGAGDERGRPHRLPGLAGGGAARPAGERGLRTAPGEAPAEPLRRARGQGAAAADQVRALTTRRGHRLLRTQRKAGETGGGPVSPALLRGGAVLLLRRGDYLRPLSIAVTSSPLAVSPENSQKNAPPRPWFFAQVILVPMVAGVS